MMPIGMPMNGLRRNNDAMKNKCLNYNKCNKEGKF